MFKHVAIRLSRTFRDARTDEADEKETDIIKKICDLVGEDVDVTVYDADMVLLYTPQGEES